MIGALALVKRHLNKVAFRLEAAILTDPRSGSDLVDNNQGIISLCKT
jgi:hypothetical protein